MQQSLNCCLLLIVVAGLFFYVTIMLLLSRDIPGSNFPNLAGAGPGLIYELKSARGQGWSRSRSQIRETFVEIMSHVVLQTTP